VNRANARHPYLRYNALVAALHELQEQYPTLLSLQSMGKSYEGREILVATVSNHGQEPDSKPAFWVDGNIHATELAPSVACLNFLQRLCGGYGHDPKITDCLDTRTFYVCPRVNPDGAEWALADSPRLIRSSTRPYPPDRLEQEGVVPEDINGDGRVLTMRIPDPDGHWKAFSEDPRLMIRREPDERGPGPYYRLMPEGMVPRWDGVDLKLTKAPQGLDLNRNFPAPWRFESDAEGSGPFPTSEPEVRSLVEFVVAHPNITGGVAFHTYGGFLLRPPSYKSDDQLTRQDLHAFKTIGDRGEELTGYPAFSVFHGFREDPNEFITGAFDDWMFEHLGLFAWTVELWSPLRQAGVIADNYFEWYVDHSRDDDRKMLRWADSLHSQALVDWTPFDHPQLGAIELGGWDTLFTFRNPPPHKVLDEVDPFVDWLVYHARISPLLELRSPKLETVGDGVYKLAVVVQNSGYLPTSVTKWAEQKKLVGEVRSKLTLPAGGLLLSGPLEGRHGQLAGRSHHHSAALGWSVDNSNDRVGLTWVFEAPRGSEVTVEVAHPRAGRASVAVVCCG